MSRTDKDLPYWMLSTFWEPYHFRCQYALFAGGRRICDLPEQPIRVRPAGHSWRSRPGGCHWVPGIPARRTYGPPRWYVRLEFTGPRRRRVRDQLTRARQEYHATGEVDVAADVTQHRHIARWHWA